MYCIGVAIGVANGVHLGSGGPSSSAMLPYKPTLGAKQPTLEVTDLISYRLSSLTTTPLRLKSVVAPKTDSSSSKLRTSSHQTTHPTIHTGCPGGCAKALVLINPAFSFPFRSLTTHENPFEIHFILKNLTYHSEKTRVIGTSTK